MIAVDRNGSLGPVVNSRLIQTKDFDVSWAGDCPLYDGFCFGSEDGRVLMMGPDGNAMITRQSVIPSREAINGIAFSKGMMALSTRAEIVFLAEHPAIGRSQSSEIPVGAYNIISTPSGRFIAPAGRSGLMTVTPRAVIEDLASFGIAEGQELNFYNSVYLPVPGREIVACAARLGGFIGTDLSGISTISSVSQKGVDIVDVCSLGENVRTPSAAAVSRDCGILLSKDVLTTNPPTVVKLPGVEGIAYRLLCANGHLMLLTSKALYTIGGVVDRFLSPRGMRNTPISVRRLPLEAVDANIAKNRWLLIVLTDGVMQIELSQLMHMRSATAVSRVNSHRTFTSAHRFREHSPVHFTENRIASTTYDCADYGDRVIQQNDHPWQSTTARFEVTSLIH